MPVNYSTVCFNPDFRQSGKNITANNHQKETHSFYQFLRPGLFPLFRPLFFLSFFHHSPTPFTLVISLHTLPICLCLKQLWRQTDKVKLSKSSLVLLFVAKAGPACRERGEGWGLSGNTRQPRSESLTWRQMMRWQTSDGGDFYLALTDTVISLFVFLQQTLVSKAGSNKRINGKSLNSWINKITSNQQNKMKGFEPFCLEGSWSCERQLHGKYIKWELKRAGKWIDFFRVITASREERNMIQCRKGDVTTCVPGILQWFWGLSSFTESHQSAPLSGAHESAGKLQHGEWCHQLPGYHVCLRGWGKTAPEMRHCESLWHSAALLINSLCTFTLIYIISNTETSNDVVGSH